jgi:hypothetical protein
MRYRFSVSILFCDSQDPVSGGPVVNIKLTARKKKRPILLPVPRFEQPDDVTCGPTCLAQVYKYYGCERSLTTIIEETPRNPDGGTLAVYLGISALRNGFRTQIYAYNLRVFDPTWWKLDVAALLRKLQSRLEKVRSQKLRRTISGYLDYLQLGGEVHFAELTQELLAGILAKGYPILTGLNATYLYGTPREYQDEYDDVRGEPVGHFVVISGYYPASRRFIVRDPSSHIPFSRTGKYSVEAQRLISAILLGDITYDAVLLVVSRR